MKKGKIIALLASVSCVATLAGAGMITNATASASQTIAGKDVSSFAMEYGASVRIPTDDSVNGIRFTATLDKDVYAELEALETDTTKVNYGIMIVPADYVQASPLTPETVFGVGGATKTYTLDACTAQEGEECTCGVKHITGLTYEKLTVDKVDDEATENTAIIRGSLVNIHDDNRTRDFVGMAYIEYDVNGEKTYAFANYSQGDVANNTRSMTYVTQLHLNAGGQDNGLADRYVTPYMDKEHRYTIEHYFPNAQGEYGDTADRTEEKWGTLNATVNAKNYAKVDASYGEWATAVMNGNENACTTDTLYVNGKTVLKCYYKAVSNVLFDSTDSNDVALLTSANEDNKNGRTAEVTTVEDSEKGTVVKVSSVDTGLWGDGYLDMAFADEKLQTATDGNWDYLTFSMRVTAEYAASGIYDLITEGVITAEQTQINNLINAGTFHLSSNNITVATFAVDEWVDVVIPKAKFNTITYKSTGAVDWTSMVTSVDKTAGTLTKESFDETFNGLYGENGSSDYIFNLGTFSGKNLSSLSGMSTAYSTTKALHDVKITYYIDQITWGVDYKAPVIDVDSQIFTNEEEGATISYTPAYTITDDILPGDMIAGNGGKHLTPIKSSHTVYAVSNGTRTPVEATDGVYELVVGNEYVLSVNSNDWSVTDIDGNESATECELSFTKTKTISAFNTVNALSNIDAEKDMTKASVYGKTYLSEYTANGITKSGVGKLETSMTIGGSNSGGWFSMNLSEAERTNIINAFNNNDTFTLSMTVCFDFDKGTGTYDSWGINFYAGKTGYLRYGVGITAVDGNGNEVTDIMQKGNWYTITFTKETLTTYCGWTTDDLILNELNGTTSFFGFSNNCVKLTDEGSPVTFYFDEISYSVA